MDNDGTLNNAVARARYKRVVRDIPSQLDRSASREEKHGRRIVCVMKPSGRHVG